MRIGEGAMHGSVAIRTTGDVRLGIMGGTRLGDGMTVDTRSRLACAKQIVGGRAVGNVAVAAIFENGRVIVDPWARLRLMALRALFGLRAEPCLLGRMGRMAIYAAQHSLTYRVMGGEVEPGSNLRVATHTKPRFGLSIRQNVAREPGRKSYVSRLAVVRIMTVRTEKVRAPMF